MHFSIPETVQETDANGSKFWNFHIHVNGVFHCKLRYSVLDKFYEQLKNDFPGKIQPRLFPGKKLFALTPDQLEERREMLEKFIQHISQDPVIGVSEQFNDFFLKAQQMGLDVPVENVDLDVYLMNGNKVTIEISTTDQTDDVLETAMKKIGLAEKYYYYFALFLVQKEDGGGISIVRKLQDFESPYLSLKAVTKPHRIIIRKNYWSKSYDEDLLEDRIAMNLLYVQITDDYDRGWMLCNDEEKKRFKKLQSQGSRKETLKLAQQKFKFYGFLHYSPCKSDYPEPDSDVLVASGDREFNIRVQQGSDKMMEGKFKVQRIRSWRLTSLSSSAENSSSDKEKLQFAFEYLFGKDELKWISIESDQAIMMSMALQGIVDEIIREKKGQGIRQPRKKDKKEPQQQDQQKQQITGVVNNKSTADTTNRSLLSGLIPDKGKKRGIKNKGAGVNEVFAHDIGDDDL